MTTMMKTVIYCKRSGLQIGTVEVQTTAGCLPYISYWDKCVGYHPVFSMSTEKLLQFTRREWTRLSALADDAETTQAENEILQVSFLAILHSLDCIRQDEAALPPLHIVTETIQKLFSLAYWKWHLESQRFSFPTLHLCKGNSNLNFANLPDYFEACFAIKKSYETQVREKAEAAKARAAEEALIALNNTWVVPASKRILWKWVVANLPSQHLDDITWMGSIFLGGPTAILGWEEDDLELMTEIIVASCPSGTGVMFAVRKRLEDILAIWKTHYCTYEIQLEDFEEPRLLVNGQKVAAENPGAEPQIDQFQGSKAKYYVAHAKWQIATAVWKKENPQ